MMNLTFRGTKFFREPRGDRGTQFKKIEKASYRTVVTPKISVFQLNQKVFIKRGLLGGFRREGEVPDFQKNDKGSYRAVVQTHTENVSNLALLGFFSNKNFSCTREVTLPIVYTVEISVSSFCIQVVLDLTYYIVRVVPIVIVSHNTVHNINILYYIKIIMYYIIL